jgi:teichuronic acid biosynthesis glycosyltransferase TuaG
MLREVKIEVDIIIPTYNPGDYLYSTINSIISQTFKNWRVLLIDDGSSPKHRKKIQEISEIDDRIHLIVLPENSGGGYARNVGLKYISADYVAFCDSDDRWPKDKLERQLKFMNKYANINMTHCDMLRLKNKKVAKVETPHAIDIDEFLASTQIFCSSVVLRTSIIKGARFGQMRARHPFKFWCSILSRGEISYNAKDTHFEYLVRDDSVSSNKLKMLHYTVLAYLLYAPSIRKAVVGIFFRAIRMGSHAK